MTDEGSRRRWRRAIGIAIGVLLLAVALVLHGGRELRDLPEIDLEQRIDHLLLERVQLQVAIHDVVEAAPTDIVVRVCRTVAERPVTLKVTEPRTVREVLESLARQVDARFIVQAGGPKGSVLPTIACTDAADYLVIGRSHRSS